MTLAIIVAATENRVIGKGGDMPWHLPADLKFFKKTTLGHPIILGRKTFESFGGRPLPKRRNLVITRNRDYKADGAELYSSLDAALDACSDDDIVFICGGASLYAEASPKADLFYLTEIHAELEGDTFLPDFDLSDWELIDETYRPADEKHAYALTWKLFKRKS